MPVCTSQNTVTADVVALEHVITFNRFGAFNPAGMVYALREDVETNDGKPVPASGDVGNIAGRIQLKGSKRARPLVLRVNEGECLKVTFTNLLSPTQNTHRSLEREGFPKGKVAEHALVNDSDSERLVDLPSEEDSDYPRTRAASMHVNGLDYIGLNGQPGILSDGANVGTNPSSLVSPGKRHTYLWYARKHGVYFMYSAGALAGGEGDGGQLGLGLFGAVNVEPRGSQWYRSQVTYDEMRAAALQKDGSTDYSKLDYGKLSISDKRRHILHSDLNAIIVQTDKSSESKEVCKGRGVGTSCGMSFREFTAIFHDENKVFQAFAELEDESNPVSKLGDGMAINYVSAGVGAPVLANRKKLGPAKECVECKLEEFFLSSWANGDPGLIVERDADGKSTQALHQADPSNVHHAYLGDPVRFRNIHAGPKETHVFHLHAHQWLRDMEDPDSSYLDSQTISPGSTLNYEIHYGGGGNRNYTVGDAIFHCHLYPHFAAGMWALWRNHDVFEDGKPGLFNPKDADRSKGASAAEDASRNNLRYRGVPENNDFRARNLPDGEIAGGTPNPAIVPIPGMPLPPLPSKDFQGYPFYIAAEPGHRPPQAPNDIAVWKEKGEVLDGGIGRHVILSGVPKGMPGDTESIIKELLATKGAESERAAADWVAKRTYRLASNPQLVSMHIALEKAVVRQLPHAGTCSERVAMAFHAGTPLDSEGLSQCGGVAPQFDFHGSSKARKDGDAPWPVGWKPRGMKDALWNGAGYQSKVTALPDNMTPAYPYGYGTQFRVNGGGNKPGAPFANPCPASAPERIYRTAYLQMDLAVNQYGWHDPQARFPLLEQDLDNTLSRKRLVEPLFFRANSGDCVHFEATNLIPSVLNLDDFQVLTPTDVIGQHIHLVKFDVTASDGSANGWNYEDGTLAADEVRERIRAHNRELSSRTGKPIDPMAGAKVHRIFRDGTVDTPDLVRQGGVTKKGAVTCPAQGKKTDHEYDLEFPWCAAQSTVQRWWADPLLNTAEKAEDRTLRAVFTHDHFGPSSHQQHGFYSALVIEPSKSVWTKLAKYPGAVNVSDAKAACDDGSLLGGSDAQGKVVQCRADGGPTSAYANIGFPGVNVGGGTAAQQAETRREFNLSFADFAIVYDEILRPVNPPTRSDEVGLPTHLIPSDRPAPEAISAEDPGTRLLNYRNEPIPLRIGSRDDASGKKDPGACEKKNCDSIEDKQLHSPFEYRQRPENDVRADVAFVFSSYAHKEGGDGLLDRFKKLDDLVDQVMSAYPQEFANDERKAFKKILKDTKARRDDLMSNLRKVEPWRDSTGHANDPSTPILGVYEGDPIKLHLVQGAQEEQHVFAATGIKWKNQAKSRNSGFSAGQPIGISEHFEFDAKISVNASAETTDSWFGSPSAENVWDGMWGLIRSYGWTRRNGKVDLNNKPDMLARLTKEPPRPPRTEGHVCPTYRDGNGDLMNPVPHEVRVVSVWFARDILGERGIAYSERYSIDDPNARLMVELTPSFLKKYALGAESFDTSQVNAQWIEKARQALKQEYAQGKPVEPLVLRVDAGACVRTVLINLLPRQFSDGRGSNASHWSYNFMPPITHGLNFNDVRSSAYVGLSAPLIETDIGSFAGVRLGLNQAPEEQNAPVPADGAMARGCRNGDPNSIGAAAWASCDGQHLADIRYWYAGNRDVLADDVAATDKSNYPDCTETLIKARARCAVRGHVERGEVRFTPVEFGAVGLRNLADPIKHSSHGLIAGLIVEPAGARVTYPACGGLRNVQGKGAQAGASCGDEFQRSRTTAIIDYAPDAARPSKRVSFREFALLFHDDLSLRQNGQPMANHRMADDAEDTGQKGFNYGTAPLWARNGLLTSGADLNDLQQLDYSNTLASVKLSANEFAKLSVDSCRVAGDPETPVFCARSGEHLRFRVIHAAGHSRQHNFVLHGHNWLEHPFTEDSTRLRHASESNEGPRIGGQGGMGPGTQANLLTCAGGSAGQSGDYLFRAQENFQFHGGLWGLLRVLPGAGGYRGCRW